MRVRYEHAYFVFNVNARKWCVILYFSFKKILTSAHRSLRIKLNRIVLIKVRVYLAYSNAHYYTQKGQHSCNCCLSNFQQLTLYFPYSRQSFDRLHYSSNKPILFCNLYGKPYDGSALGQSKAIKTFYRIIPSLASRVCYNYLIMSCSSFHVIRYSVQVF